MNIDKLIGNTPMIKISVKYNDREINVFSKLEYYNFTGSIKDRLANYIIKESYKSGNLVKGMPIVEATSGNTGISFAALGAYYGHPVHIFMPDWASQERINIMKLYGAKVYLVSKEEGGFREAIKRADELALEINGFRPDQFNNKLNVEAHYYGIGLEILNKLDKIDTYVSGIGTGGTFTGCAKYLKEKDKNTLCIGIEPSESKVLKGEKSSTHRIEGIGANFIPSILDKSYLDDIIDVDSETAYLYTNVLYKEEGLMCGVSSGAAIYAGIEMGKKYINKNIVIILPDDGNRYLSKGLYKN